MSVKKSKNHNTRTFIEYRKIKENSTVVELNDNQLYGYRGFKSDNSYVQIGTDYIRQIGSNASYLHLILRKRFNRYSTVLRQDIQEVKNRIKSPATLKRETIIVVELVNILYTRKYG